MVYDYMDATSTGIKNIFLNVSIHNQYLKKNCFGS